jgi:hypothetical protein
MSPEARGSGPEGPEESRRILERVERESATWLRSATETASRHFGAGDAPPDDPVEIWGRRIGRTLGFAFAVAVVIAILGLWGR